MICSIGVILLYTYMYLPETFTRFLSLYITEILDDPGFENMDLTESGAIVSSVENQQAPQISTTESKSDLRSLMMTSDGSVTDIGQVEYSFDWTTT